MDFTLKTYHHLLESLIEQGYAFQTFRDFLIHPEEKAIVLRHDVDKLPFNSLAFARIQAGRGIKGVYYFRAVPESWDEAVIKEIASLGHEIGYHYESLTTCKGNREEAIRDFEKNLAALRKLAPVNTICMHGSPMSPHDSKDLWKQCNYRDYGIIGEPYFDVDFTRVLYLTDTGRKWNGADVSVRDKVNSELKLNVRHTDELIAAVSKGKLSPQVMFTFHPQRWTDSLFPWTKELFLQNLKNGVKKYFFVKKSS
ncbi:MAG: hypothetical protein K0R65_2354 [Crocinitomicaceae bacterium]|jgi:hypothetical protein|nr:hypothetical protein [Crocinitomicaceae bacterium]